MTTIAVNSKIEHTSEGLKAEVIAIAYVKQNACVKFEDGYIQMMDLEDIEANYKIIG